MTNLDNLLDQVKLSLRLKTDMFDKDEILPLIEACILDLYTSGVDEYKITEDNPLVKRAIILYCKANFGFNEDAERYNKSYQMVKEKLALSGGYNDE